MIGKETFFRFGELVGSNAVFRNPLHLVKDFFLRSITLVGIGNRPHVDEPFPGREGVESRSDLMDQPFLLTNLGIENGAGTRAENRGENLDGRSIGTCGSGSTPSDIHATEVGREGITSLLLAELRWLLGNRHGF